MANENIFLFIPNIIGYIRIALTTIACYWMFTDPLKSAFCFVLSHTFLDDLDGIAARRFKQEPSEPGPSQGSGAGGGAPTGPSDFFHRCPPGLAAHTGTGERNQYTDGATRFGGVFDIVIDRCSFMMWLMGLSILYPQYVLLFQLNCMLDIMRMWMKVYSSSIAGKRNHKQTRGNWILNMYYSDDVCLLAEFVVDRIIALSQTGLHIFSYGSEVFFVMLHLCYFSPGPKVSFLGYGAGLWQISAVLLFPLVIMKVPINLLILKTGCQDIAAVDLAERTK